MKTWLFNQRASSAMHHVAFDQLFTAMMMSFCVLCALRAFPPFVPGFEAISEPLLPTKIPEMMVMKNICNEVIHVKNVVLHAGEHHQIGISNGSQKKLDLNSYDVIMQ